MSEFLSNWYPWIKAGHIVSVISWMAGLFYLPRLFVYHVEGHQGRGVLPGSDMDLLFQRQERLLLRAIMAPASVATWVFGLCLVVTPGIVDWSQLWPWVKAVSVIAMTGFHHWLMMRRKDFLQASNRLSGRDYRLANEIPTVLMLLIVIAVVVKF